jgi:hypothetical protein
MHCLLMRTFIVSPFDPAGRLVLKNRMILDSWKLDFLTLRLKDTHQE